MLSLHQLRLDFVRYRGVTSRLRLPCLDGVDLAVAAGQLVALIGASGAGKSLVAHAILGILPDNAELGGTMRFRGEPLDAVRQRRLRGRSIALVPQSIGHLDPLAACGRQLGWAALRAGVPAGTVPERALRAIDRYGLDRRVLRAFPHQLSGGMARRVLLAIATVADADLIVADEPTRGLDATAAGAVLRHLRQLADRGKAVLLVSHDLSAVLPVADRVVVMRDGATLDAVPASDFTGDGAGLRQGYTRELWRALPRNGFSLARGG